MPKNINIQEGGDPKYMNEVKYIQTNLQGSGTCLWVPVDDVKLGTKTITKNGSYSASKSGFYGFEKVIVNVPGGDSNKTNNGKLADEDGNEAKDGNGNSIDPAPSGGSGSSVSGTDPDDGNDYKVDVDENGNLKKTKLPSRIEVTRNPDKTNYTSGETLNPSGIIVHAYYGDDSDYGTVLNSELGFDPMTVSGSGEASNYSGTNVTVGDYTFPYIYCEERNFHWNDNPNVSQAIAAVHRDGSGDGNWYAASSVTVRVAYYGNGSFIVVSNQPLGLHGEKLDANLGVSSWSADNNGERFEYNHKAVYYFLAGYYHQYIVRSFIQQSDIGSNNMGGAAGSLAWAMFYGGVEASQVDINVNWNRPADKKKLTTSFKVSVVGANGSSNDSSNESSGGGGSHGF